MIFEWYIQWIDGGQLQRPSPCILIVKECSAKQLRVAGSNGAQRKEALLRCGCDFCDIAIWHTVFSRITDAPRDSYDGEAIEAIMVEYPKVPIYRGLDLTKPLDG